MMKFVFIFLCLLVSAFVVVAQPPDTSWTRRYGTSRHDVCNSLKQTSDFGFIMAGSAFVDTALQAPPDSQDILLVKVDSLGNEQWMVEIGGNEMDDANDIEQTNDGGYILAGSTGQWFLANPDAFVAKTDSVGALIWDWRYGGSSPEYATDIEALPNGHFLASGTIYSRAGSDIWVAELSEIGLTVWMRTYGAELGTSWGLCRSMKLLEDGGFVLAGSSHFGNAVYLIRANSIGDTVWTLQWTEDTLFVGLNNIEADTGGFMIFGSSCGNPDCYNQHPYSAAVTASGEVVERYAYAQEIGLEPRRGIIAEGRGYVFAGSFVNSGPALIKCDETGAILWIQNYHWNGHLNDILEMPDQSYIAAGDQFEDFYLLKTQPDTVSLAIAQGAVPANFSILSFPNPFNTLTMVSLTLPVAQRVRLNISDLLGRHITTLHDGILEPGEHRFTFDASALPSGIYFARVQSGEFVKTQKLLLLK